MKATRLVACLLGVALCWSVLTSDSPGQDRGRQDIKFQVPTLGDLVMLPDAKTLVVSVPSAGELWYYDTVNDKQLKKVDVEFQPTAMAVQGKSIFVVKKGTTTIHVIDVASGKGTKELKISGDPIQKLACAPGKGLLYATNEALDVYAIDPETGKSSKTKAGGQEIVVDPAGGEFVYTSVYSSTKDRLLVQEIPGQKAVSIQLVKGKTANLLLKFQVTGNDLKCVAANENGGSGGAWFSVSRDGKLIAMSGPYRGPNVKGLNFNITVFETGDLKTPAGTLDHSAFPRAIAFHPQLDLVATIADGNPKQAFVFNAKSFAKKQTFEVPNLSIFPYKVIFGGEGSKLISAVGMLKTGKQDAAVAISVHDLTLTDEQKAELKKALKK
jgi:hypothetical protein